MLIEPKIRNNVCLTAHPLGCALQVRDAIRHIKSRPGLRGTNAALIIGSSNGYGLGARIVAAYACRAPTLGIAYERASSDTRPGTAGFYNDRAFLQYAAEDGIPAWSINGDAFSGEVKRESMELLRSKIGPVDLVIYSIAAPRRLDSLTGIQHASVIKPIGRPYTAKTVDFQSGEVFEVHVEPASETEVRDTVKVMGGEDWKLWIETLEQEKLLAKGATTVAFSYIGPAFTGPIYREGTIGRAKEHLEATARELNMKLAETGGRALISVNKALVTRASAVIPAVPLYIALLYRVMKDKRLHENCLQQMDRLFREYLYGGAEPRLDTEGRIRLDDREMRADVQEEVARLLDKIDSDNVRSLSDLEGFRREFLRHHGFGRREVDYTADVQP
jgi:enoyl-[acyl-carrier protein] reductase/trans-2-enoyl-CoA reductase (NAD+)